MNKDEILRKAYHKVKNQNTVKIRLNQKEKILLDEMMRKEEWINVSGFIKYKLFGKNIDEKYRRFIKNAPEKSLVEACYTELQYLNSFLAYIEFRYEKDMKQLYREEGVDIDKWISVTNDAHIQAGQLLSEVYKTFKNIVDKRGADLGVKSSKPSDEPLETNDEPEEPLKRCDYDRVAQELFEEYPDRFL